MTWAVGLAVIDRGSTCSRSCLSPRPQRQPCLFRSPERHGQTNQTTQAPTVTEIGAGGVPAKTGTFLNNNFPGVEFGGTIIEGQPISPGEAFRVVAKTPCTASGTAAKCSTPDAYGEALTTFYNANGIPTPDGPAVPLPPGTTVEIGRTIPGSAVRLFTPGCGKGGPRPQITVTAGGASQTVDAPCVG